MKDQELRTLEELSNGGSDLRAVTAYLKDKRVAGQLIAASHKGKFPDVLRHVLLRSSPADAYTAEGAASGDLWRALAGSGKAYTGAFGPLNYEGCAPALEAAGVVGVSFSSDHPPAPLAEQAALCVRCAADHARQTPLVLPLLQRHLSQILLDHPVLLHPGLLCNIQSDGNEVFMGLVHAIARTRCLSLPRRRHFTSSASATGEPIVQRLTNFAKHPSLEAGMRGESLHVWVESDSVNPARQKRSIEGHFLTARGAHTAGPMVAMLASMMELDELRLYEGVDLSRAIEGEFRGVELPFMDADQHVHRNSTWHWSLSPAMKPSFYVACGLGDDLYSSAPAAAQLGAHEDFLDLLRRRSQTMAAGGWSVLEPTTSRRVIFGPRGFNATGAEIRERVHTLCRGMVRAQASPEGEVGASAADVTLATAAGDVLEACIGHKMDSTVLPFADVPGALAFLQAVDELGGIGSMTPAANGHVASATMKVLRIREELRNTASSIAGRDTWLQAVEVFWASKRLNEVIKSTVGVDQANVEAGQQPAVPSKPRLAL